MVQVCEKAADLLTADGISAEVIDPRTIVPLDEDTLLQSARKTSRVIVVDEGHQSYGVTAEIASRINEKAFYHLDAPVLRVEREMGRAGALFAGARRSDGTHSRRRGRSRARRSLRGELYHAA